MTIMTHLGPLARPGGAVTPTPTEKPTALVTGLVARSVQQAQGALRALVDGVVLDFNWDQLHTGMGAFNTTMRDSIRADLDWCANNTGTSGRPLLVRMRPRLGIYAPAWVRTLTGEMTWYTNNNTQPEWPSAPSDPRWKQIPGGTPVWWTTAYKDAARDLFNIIATQFGSHPALAEVVMGWPTTQFAEPCNKQFGCAENVDVAVAAGYTDALDDACFLAGWQAHKELLQPKDIACYTAYNPPGAVNHVASTFSFGNVERAIRLMETEMATLGPFAILGNNSLSGEPPPLSQYGLMYARMRTARDAEPPTDAAVQTETLAKHIAQYPVETVRNTIQTALGWRFTGVEIPIGCQTFDPLYPENFVDPAYAQSVNPQFYANSLELVA